MAQDRNPLNQKIGDYYAACMDEKAIETAGAAPLKADLERIAALHSKSDLANVIAAMPGLNAPFDFHSDQDYKNSSQVIAEVDQGGLGLPDRDYYLKTDPKSVELRQAYVAHVQKMFELLGDAPGIAATEAQTVLRIETALAKGSLTQVERRDPKMLYHKMTRRQLETLSPSFRWKEYFSLAGQPGIAVVECDGAGVLQSDGLNAENRRPRKLEGLPALAPGERECFLSLFGIRERRFRFLRQDSYPARSNFSRAGGAASTTWTTIWARPWDRPTCSALFHPRPNSVPRNW